MDGQAPSGVTGRWIQAKLTTALAGGTAPDVTQIEFDHLPQYIAAHELVNIAQYVSSYKSDFPTWTWDQVSQGSAVYAVPEDIGPMGLLYQPSVLKKYNLPVPTTWGQFASDAVALHKANPNMYMTWLETGEGDLWESLFWQAGAFPYTQEPNGSWKVTLDGTLEQKVVNFWGNLVKEGAIVVD